MKDILDHIRYEEDDVQSAESLLYQIEYLIREWRATRYVEKPEVRVTGPQQKSQDGCFLI